MKTYLTVNDIAAICHEANRTYCASLEDHSQLPWAEAPGWQTASAIDGVRFHLDHPFAGPADSHENWLKTKIAEGWTYAPVKDPEAREHPCCMPFLDLPLEQQAKDRLFMAIVHALAPICDENKPL